MATILLSDPDERSRVMITALLEAMGHRVSHEPADPVDAAVIDPGCRQALADVRRLRARRHLPVICVSGKRKGPNGLGLDPVAFLPKPVPVGSFVRAIEAAV